MTNRPTQKDVARLAGVSRATVSFVLNNRRDVRVPISDQTRKKVMDAAQQLEYQPSDLARSLRSGASMTIGFMMPAFHNPHYWDVFEGAESEITAHGYHLLQVVSNLNPDREQHALQSLFQQRLDGMILMPTFLDLFPDEVRALRERSIPVVFITRVEDMDFVYPDIKIGSEQVMDHLLGLGHRRIGFINGVARQKMSQARQEVYLQKLIEANIPIDNSLIRCCGYLMEDGFREAQALLNLPNPPTAIWTINDYLAIGALRGILSSGRRVPQDISLVGFDDISFASQLYPPLTTVHMPSFELGRLAAQFLFNRLGSGAGSGPQQEVLPTHLVIRQSTMPPNTHP